MAILGYMNYNSFITVDLLSLARWEECGWQSPVTLLTPDMTVRFGVTESMEGNSWKVNLSVDTVTMNNDLADESLKDRIVNAVKERCLKDIKIIQIFGESLRKGRVKRQSAQANMFADTDFKVSFNHRYRFIMALDGVSLEKLDGIYLVPSYLQVNKEGYDKDPFYKMCCYERL